MASARNSPSEQQILDRLRMVGVAKDLFVSDWYQSACRKLDFSRESCEKLTEISRESRRERDEAFEVLAAWADRLSAEPDFTVRAFELSRVARRDFLIHLIDMKQAAGEVFERAAMLSPIGFRDELHRLAAEDFRHAVTLRELLAREAEGL